MQKKLKKKVNKIENIKVLPKCVVKILSILLFFSVIKHNITAGVQPAPLDTHYVHSRRHSFFIFIHVIDGIIKFLHVFIKSFLTFLLHPNDTDESSHI